MVSGDTPQPLPEVLAFYADRGVFPAQEVAAEWYLFCRPRLDASSIRAKERASVSEEPDVEYLLTHGWLP